jgi:hypothetical protein
MSLTLPGASIFVVRLILMLFNTGFTGKHPSFSFFNLNPIQDYKLFLANSTNFGFQKEKLNG